MMSLSLFAAACLAVDSTTRGDRAAGVLQDDALAPVDDIDKRVEFCRLDLDCTRLGDVGATCDEFTATCICSTAEYTGDICYPKPDNEFEAVLVVGIIAWTFPEGFCSQFLAIAGAQEAFEAVLRNIFGEVLTYFLCGSVSVVVEANIDAKNFTALHQEATTKLMELAATENYTEALNYREGQTILTSYHGNPSEGVPSCVVLDSTKEIVLNDVCRALDCRPGYQRNDYYVNSKIVSSCELITEGDDSPLTDTAIAGVIFGFVLLLGIIIYVCWNFFVRSEPEGAPVENSPYGDEENYGAHHEPYGKCDVEPYTESDVAV